MRGNMILKNEAADFKGTEPKSCSSKCVSPVSQHQGSQLELVEDTES